MLDYSSLAALAAVVREGSFERAAKALHVTPSAVSQRIRLLEERLGCALVIRGQPCTATEIGHLLCQHVDRVALLEEELRARLPHVFPAPPAQAIIPVAVNADSLATWFTRPVTTFARDAPVLLHIFTDDEGHTAQWLRSGRVLAAVTAQNEPAAGCNSHLLGALRYVAAASPAFVARHFPSGVNVESVRKAPCLRFNAKDELQHRWVQRYCGIDTELPCHLLPSPHAFVDAALGGLGWGLHPQPLVQAWLRSGDLVELIPDGPLDVPLYWQHARMASSLLRDLTAAVRQAAQHALIQPV